MSAKGLSRDNIVKDVKTSKQFRRAIRYRGLTGGPAPPLCVSDPMM